MANPYASQLSQDDLIVARATPPGRGAIAIVRVDGSGVAELVRALFEPVGDRAPVDFPREAIFGKWVDPEAREVIDEGLTIFFRGPHSYTGNDLAEFHAHGGEAIVRRLISIAMSLGARVAEPGEFTRRAFLNGRMDLAQAEAVADLVNAETEAASRAAHRILAGGLSAEIEEIRQLLIELSAEIEARIDFPEEGIDAADRTRMDAAFGAIRERIDKLLVSRWRGKLLRDGATVALVGPPNVGKSSLMNALARTERAIVTPHPGTTRDTIECTIDLNGIPVTLIDTAGLRDTTEPVERIGIERAREAIDQADCVIEVADATKVADSTSVDDPSSQPHRAADIRVENKSDLLSEEARRERAAEIEPAGGDPSEMLIPVGETMLVSALTGDGIEQLEERICGLLSGEEPGADRPGRGGAASGIAINERHSELLFAARKDLGEADHGWHRHVGSELVMVDLRAALAALDEILGLAPSEAILDRVFERFCLGK